MTVRNAVEAGVHPTRHRPAPTPQRTSAMSAVGKPGGSQSFGVWVSREEWKRQQVEMKRGTEAYNQVLQEIEKKDRTIEALRSSNEEAAAARHNAEEKVRSRHSRWHRLSAARPLFPPPGLGALLPGFAQRRRPRPRFTTLTRHARGGCHAPACPPP